MVLVDDSVALPSHHTFHQFGGEEVGRPGLAARPYLGLSAEDEADLDAIIDAWLEGQISGRSRVPRTRTRRTP